MLGIDLGSNTLRAVEMDENLNIIKEAEYIIGTAKDLDKTGVIGEQALLNLKNAFSDLLFKGYDIKNAKAYATAAFRKADNALEIIQNIEDEFGLKIEIIDEKTEAKLSILAMKEVLKQFRIYDENMAYCDLGGGSCELSFGTNIKSFEFGIITFYEKALNKNLKNISNSLKFSKKMIERLKQNGLYKKDKKLILHFLVKDKNLKKLAFFAFDEIEQAKKHLKNFKGRKIILNSGLPTSLLAMKLGIKYENYQANLVHTRCIFLNEFLNFGLKLWNMPEKEAQIWVGKNRKNYLVAGCFLFYALFCKYKFIVVDEGLREGICIKEIKNLRI